jgi:hypothetical protein
MLLSALIGLVVSITSTILSVQAATTDQSCLDACSDYSVVLGYCRIIYGNERKPFGLDQVCTLLSDADWRS